MVPFFMPDILDGLKWQYLGWGYSWGYSWGYKNSEITTTRRTKLH